MTTPDRTTSRDRSATGEPQFSNVRAVLVLVFLSLFVLLLTLSCAVYPGGNWIDRGERAHSFWRNLMCDLVQPIALNGVPNALGAHLAQVSMLSFCVAVAAFCAMTASRLHARPRLARAIVVSGVCSLVLTPAIPLTPSQQFGDLHVLVVLAAALPTMVAGVCSVVGFFLDRSTHRAVAWLGALALALALVDALVMAHQVATDAPITPVMPAIQRLTMLGVLAWMYPSAVFALRAATVDSRTVRN